MSIGNSQLQSSSNMY